MIIVDGFAWIGFLALASFPVLAICGIPKAVNKYIKNLRRHKLRKSHAKFMADARRREKKWIRVQERKEEEWIRTQELKAEKQCRIQELRDALEAASDSTEECALRAQIISLLEDLSR